MGVVMPLFLYKKLADGTQIASGTAFPIIALITSVLAVVCYVACYFLCTERVQLKEKQQNISFRHTVKALIGNRALVGISLVFIFMLAAQMLSQTINNYIFKDYFGNTTGLSVMNAAGFVPILLLAPLAVPLSRRFGKKELGIFAAALGAVAFMLLFLLRTRSMWVYTIINIVGLLGFGLFNLIVWAFVSDVIDDHQVRTGHREDGTIYAVCSFARKLGQAIASALGGWSLGWIGYAEGSAVGQSQAVREGIYTIATLVPMLLYLAVAACLFYYPLNKARVANNAAILKRRT